MQQKLESVEVVVWKCAEGYVVNVTVNCYSKAHVAVYHIEHYKNITLSSVSIKWQKKSKPEETGN